MGLPLRKFGASAARGEKCPLLRESLRAPTIRRTPTMSAGREASPIPDGGPFLQVSVPILAGPLSVIVRACPWESVDVRDLGGPPIRS